MSAFTSTLLRQSYERFAENKAISLSGAELSYTEFFGQCEELLNYPPAKTLIDSANSIAVLADKSLTGYQCLSLALLSNAAYVPLNTKYPAERNKIIIEASQASLLVSYSSLRDQAITLTQGLEHPVPIYIVDSAELIFTEVAASTGAQNEDRNEKTTFIASDTAYILFTSGSTGTPKGVPISDGNLRSYLSNIQTVCQFEQSDRFTQFFDFTFDLSLHDLFVCWNNGACLFPPDKSASLMPLNFVKKHSLTVWFSVPTLATTALRLLHASKKNAAAFESIRMSLFCGEALSTDLARKWKAITFDAPILNLYGPTEATIAFNSYRFSDSIDLGAIVPIGTPMGTNKVKIDSSGELLLGGPQVFSHYLHEAPEQRHREWYHSGDLVSGCSETTLEFHGRMDRQVQLGGHRVELQEVEALIAGIIGNECVAAITRKDKTDADYLLVYYAHSPLLETEVLAACRSQLPYYMVPAKIASIAEIPTNASGKVDYNNLNQLLEGQGNS